MDVEGILVTIGQGSLHSDNSRECSVESMVSNEKAVPFNSRSLIFQIRPFLSNYAILSPALRS